MVDRHSFHLENVEGQDLTTVLESFCLEYYGSAPSVPPQIVVPREAGDLSALAEFLSEKRGARVEVRSAERGEKRTAAAARGRERAAVARHRPGGDRPEARAARRGARGAARGAEPRVAAVADRVLRHLARDGPGPGRLDGRLPGRDAEEVGLPQVRDQGRERRPGRLRGDGRGDLAPFRAPLRRDGRDARRVVRVGAEPRRHRRRQGPALGGARRDAGVRPAAGGRDRAREADRGGLRAGPERADRPVAAQPRASAAPADPRRGAPLRARLPPAAARDAAASPRSSTTSKASGLRAAERS